MLPLALCQVPYRFFLNAAVNFSSQKGMMPPRLKSTTSCLSRISGGPLVQILSALILSLSITCFASIDHIEPKAPHSEQTPGELCNKNDPDYHGDRYKEKIPYCQRNVSYHERQKVYEDYDVPAKIRSEYTIDHLIPLSLGGSNDLSNLWPEHKKIKALRPYLEQEVFEDLRDGRITQKKAIRIILEAKLNPEAFAY
jgi:hypothetical protein